MLDDDEGTLQPCCPLVALMIPSWTPPPGGPGLVVAGGSWQLIGQDVPALHPLTFVLQAIHPVTEGVALRLTAQTDTTFQKETGPNKNKQDHESGNHLRITGIGQTLTLLLRYPKCNSLSTYDLQQSKKSFFLEATLGNAAPIFSADNSLPPMSACPVYMSGHVTHTQVSCDT